MPLKNTYLVIGLVLNSLIVGLGVVDNRREIHNSNEMKIVRLTKMAQSVEYIKEYIKETIPPLALEVQALHREKADKLIMDSGFRIVKQDERDDQKERASNRQEGQTGRTLLGQRIDKINSRIFIIMNTLRINKK